MSVYIRWFSDGTINSVACLLNISAPACQLPVKSAPRWRMSSDKLPRPSWYPTFMFVDTGPSSEDWFRFFADSNYRPTILGHLKRVAIIIIIILSTSMHEYPLLNSLKMFSWIVARKIVPRGRLLCLPFRWGNEREWVIMSFIGEIIRKQRQTISRLSSCYFLRVKLYGDEFRVVEQL